MPDARLSILSLVHDDSYSPLSAELQPPPLPPLSYNHPYQHTPVSPPPVDMRSKHLKPYAHSQPTNHHFQSRSYSPSLNQHASMAPYSRMPPPFTKVSPTQSTTTSVPNVPTPTSVVLSPNEFGATSMAAARQLSNSNGPFATASRPNMYAATVSTASSPFTPKSPQTVIVKTPRGKRHRCTHAGCGRDFSRLSNLKAHWRRHSGEEPYSCMHCNRKFKWRSSLKSHELGCVYDFVRPTHMNNATPLPQWPNMNRTPSPHAFPIIDSVTPPSSGRAMSLRYPHSIV